MYPEGAQPLQPAANLARAPSDRRVPARLVAGAALALAARTAPAALVLAQWLKPGYDPGAIPGACRWRGPRNERREIALTFDDGPDPVTTRALLADLERLGAVGTFFCLGSRVESHAGVVSEIAERGHEVATHGYRHERHLMRSAGWIRRDLELSLRALGAAGVRPSFFRPPYGLVTIASMSAARRLGLTTVLWSAWGREWADGDVASITRRLEARLGPGAIVLLHDSDAESFEGTAARGRQALCRIVDHIAERGLKPVTMSELVAP